MYVAMETHCSLIFSNLTKDRDITDRGGHWVGHRAAFPWPTGPLSLAAVQDAFLAGLWCQPLRGEPQGCCIG